MEETGNLQSFVLKDDHTKLEVFKLERIASGEKEPLSWPAAAEFVLCEAVLDENGGAKTENGAYLYRKDRIVDSWKADDLSEYVPAIPEAYEKMFGQYGNEFRQFSWKRNSGKSLFRRCQTSGGYGDGKQKNHHTDLGIIGWKQNAGLSHS